MQKSFIGRVVEEVWSEHESLENIVFVLPSRRACTFLKNCLAQKTARTIFAPEVYGIESFIEKVSGITYATDTELLFTLYHAYLQVIESEKEAFVDFTKWARTLLADFDEIDRYLIEPNKIFSYLSAITEVDHWYLKKEKTPLMEDYIKFWDSLEPLYVVFRDLLLERNKGHQGLVYRRAFEDLPAYLETRKGTKHIFLGFNALNKAESLIIQNILTSTSSKIYWDLDQYFIESSYHDAGFFIRQHLKSWPYYRQQPFPKRNEGFLSEKNIQITGVPKNVSQAKYIGQLLGDLAETSKSSLQNTAVVLGDESLLNPILNALPSSIEKVNITMGYPLRYTPMAGLFVQLYELYTQTESHGWSYKKILSLISLPQIQLMMSENEKEALDRLKMKIQNRNLLYLTPEILAAHFPNTGPLLFNSQNKRVAVYIQSCLSLIEKLRTTTEQVGYHLEEDHLYGFYILFNQLKEITISFPYVKDIRTLYSLFLDLLTKQTIDFRGEPLQGLQIMGMLESRVLDFETVIISSLNEGILPSGKQLNSFIPFEIKKEMGLPTYKEKDAVYTYHFYRLLQRAKYIYLVYNTESDVLIGGEPSRLIHQLMTDRNISGCVSHNLATMDKRPDTITPLIVHKDPALSDEIEKIARKGFSPTSLTQYIRNPLDFYKKFVLGIDDSDIVEETIAAKTFGTIIHNSLEELLKPYVGSSLNPDLLRSLKTQAEQVVKRHFTSFYDESSIRYGRNSIAFHVIVRNIENFLDAEIELSKSKEIRLIAIEKNFEISLQIPEIPYPVKLKGKLDRIDEVDGRLRIVDYKTGKVNLSDMNVVIWEDTIREPNLSKAFQVLCYALMFWSEYEENSLDAGIISFKNLKEGFLSFATKEKKGSRTRNTGINADVLEKFRIQLFELIREICDPGVPFTEKTD